MLIIRQEQFQYAVRVIETEGRVAVDTETTGLNPFGRDRIVGISVFAPSVQEAYYFPFRHGQGDNLPIEWLKPLLVKMLLQVWTTWNGKFDLKMFRKEYLNLGIDVYPYRIEDAMLAAHLLNENEPNFKLKDTADRYAKYLGYTDRLPSADQHGLDLYLLEQGLSHADMWRAPAEIVAPYAEADVVLTEKLRNLYEEPLRRWALYDLWQQNNDYLVVIEKMEERGIALDTERTKQLHQECMDEQQQCIQQLQDLSHIPNFNPNSVALFKTYLNQQLTGVHNLAPITSTDAPTLETLLDEVPEDSTLYRIIELAIKYRQWVKIGSTYYAAFLKNLYKGVIHPNFNQTGTVTGRFSSGDPINMQAIPRHDESNAGKPAYRVKESFIARSGFWLLEIDYKMAEVFIGSHIAKAKNMLRLMEQGVDVHAETAKMLEKVSSDTIPRAIAKRMNFGMMYGIGPDAFVADVKKHTGMIISRKQAEEYLHRYQQVHPEMKKMYYDLEQEARNNKFIRMLTGRVRHYNGSEFYGKNGEKGSPYHKASSNMVQGTVGEIMRIASMAIQEQLEGRAWQLLHVHDMMLFEVREGDIDTINRIQELMCLHEVNGQRLSVPMRVDIKVGHRWSDLKLLKEVLQEMAP